MEEDRVPPEDGLDDDDDMDAEVLDVDRVIVNTNGSLPIVEVDMIKKAVGRFARRKRAEKWD